MYVMTFEGDLPRTNHNCENPISFHDYDDAVGWIKAIFLSEKDEYGYYLNMPDPEDDRIVLWHIDPPNMIPVWHFSGWHYPDVNGEYDIIWRECPEQGVVPGFDKSLYSLAMEDY